MKLTRFVLAIVGILCSATLVTGTQSIKQNLWLECSCMHATDRNSSNWGAIAFNSSQARHAKNDCYLIFITAASDEIVAFRFDEIQLREGCSDYVEIFPFLREAVIENSTNPEYAFCNTTKTITKTKTKTKTETERTKRTDIITFANQTNANGHVDGVVHGHATVVLDWPQNEFIYSANKILGIRVRFKKPQPATTATTAAPNNWTLNITGAYRFLKKENFKNDGRLISGTYCDYYFFADDYDTPKMLNVWKYFHSPRFPAKYPSHIKCAYKFIGRPESRVEIIFEELHIPKQGDSCNMDKLTIFDAEATNMNAVIDVICGSMSSRHALSSGPDLLVEFNASSNITAKGFRGKFKFLQNAITPTTSSIATPASSHPTEAIVILEKLTLAKPFLSIATNMIDSIDVENFISDKENCKYVFDSRVNKFGRFETAQLFAANSNANQMTETTYRCRYEFLGTPYERVQIKFLDFSIPTEGKNSSECKPNDSLQLLSHVRGKYEVSEMYCGAFLPKPIMSKDSKLLLQFVGKYPPTTSKIHYYGFKAEFKFVTNYGIMTGQQLGNNCTFVYNSTIKKSSWFGSPNFPGLYPQNMECNYNFYGESGEKVVIRFTYFDVEGIGTCEYLTASDYVEFSNFMSTDRKYTKFCGKRDKFVIRSDGRFFRVTFYSNDRFDKTGFRALYDFEADHIPSENTSTQSYVSIAPSQPMKMLKLLLFCPIILLYLNYKNYKLIMQ